MMKKLSKIALLAAASAFMLAVFPACGDDDDGDDDPSVKIVTEQSTTVEVDGTIDLMAEVSNFPEGEVTYDWKSDKTDIATVAQNPENKAQAQVKAFAAGTAKITVTATVGDTVATADVTVTVATEGSTPPSQTENYVLDITAIPETTGTTNKLDDTVTVISTATNSSGSSQTIKYSSNGYVQMSGAKAQSTYGLQLTLPKAATITVTATKKNNGSANAIVLLSSDGTSEVAKTGGIDANGATSLTEYTLDVSEAGTYILGADANGCFLFSLKIAYK